MAACDAGLAAIGPGLHAMIDTQDAAEEGFGAVVEVEKLRVAAARAAGDVAKAGAEPGDLRGDYLKLSERFAKGVAAWSDAARADDLNRVLGAQQDLAQIADQAEKLLTQLSVRCPAPEE